MKAPARPTGIMWHVPGKGGWKSKDFRTLALAEKFVDRLVAREGSDVEVRWSLS